MQEFTIDFDLPETWAPGEAAASGSPTEEAFEYRTRDIQASLSVVQLPKDEGMPYGEDLATAKTIQSNLSPGQTLLHVTSATHHGYPSVTSLIWSTERDDLSLNGAVFITLPVGTVLFAQVIARPADPSGLAPEDALPMLEAITHATLTAIRETIRVGDTA